MSHIHIILTGGTIAKTYNPATESTELEFEGIVEEYFLSRVKPHADITFETLFLKDSLELTDEDRLQILKATQNAPSDKVMIVHGTSTMTQTQDVLDGQIGGKTVILTGAMYPLKEFAMSDAGFNLGYAMAQVRSLPGGVYICMQGETFKTGAVTKNVEEARFTAK